MWTVKRSSSKLIINSVRFNLNWFSTSQNQIELIFFYFYILETETYRVGAKTEPNQNKSIFSINFFSFFSLFYIPNWNTNLFGLKLSQSLAYVCCVYNFLVPLLGKRASLPKTCLLTIDMSFYIGIRIHKKLITKCVISINHS